jgi:predicted  nucleic acid-binding Zn ribbon protein
MIPAVELCECAPGTAVKLMTAAGPEPLHCLDCNLVVTLEALGLDDELARDLLAWGRIRHAVDALWLDSQEYEEWALRQLSDLASGVNHRGLALRRRLGAADHDAYYWFFQDQSVEDFHAIGRCPECRRALEAYDAGIFRQLLCPDCRIATVG